MSSRRQHRIAAVSLVLLVLLAACGGSAVTPAGDETPENGGTNPGDDGTNPGDDGTDSGDDGDEVGNAGLDEEIEAARDMLAAGPGSEQEPEVVVAERVTWPDAALGCPRPDELYTQALVEGYRIVLAVDGNRVAFHGAEGEPPFRCDDPQPPAP